MEFWGVEVKAGESLKVKSEDDKILHLSQASLGESKKDKGTESVPLFLKIDQQKLVLGTLSPATIPQLSFDLVFDKEFELSHNWKHGSVYFMGYKSVIPDDATEEFSEFDDSESDEEKIPVTIENGKPELKVEQAKSGPTNDNAAKAKAKVEEPSKVTNDEEDDEDDSDDDLDEDDSEEDESDEDMSDAEDGSDEGSESEEETPKKVVPGKKRPTESATKTPVPVKKAKLVSPQKTDGKKGGGHTATPHPNKKAAKTPASLDKAKAQTPKSGGQVSCKSCSKTFNSEAALQSHSKAKHGGS